MKETSSQTSACATRERPRVYNLSHVPELIHPQRSGIKHPLKSVVLPRQSAAHNQLLVFAPSITQLILKKKKNKNQAPGILRNIQIFTTVFPLITKSVTKAYSTLCTNSTQMHGGAVAWHSDTASMGHGLELLSARSSPPVPHSSAEGVSHSAINK